MKKEYICFSMKLAGFLMQRGFVLKRMEKSARNPKRNVFLFNESEDLLNAVKVFMNK